MLGIVVLLNCVRFYFVNVFSLFILFKKLRYVSFVVLFESFVDDDAVIFGVVLIVCLVIMCCCFVLGVFCWFM